VKDQDSDAIDARSELACPVCGQHRLTLLYFPSTDLRGVRPYDELLGMGDPSPETEPGIGCLNCGSEWPDLDAFRQAAADLDETDQPLI
jgi:hypothetical protein